MAYLKEEEISDFCGLVSGVTMAHVEQASFLIDAYVGGTFQDTEYKESISFIKTPTKRNPFVPFRGKLRHLPRIMVNDIRTTIRSIFGERDVLVFEDDCLEFDEPTSPYFSFFPPTKTFMFRPVGGIKNLQITYHAGYLEDEYPMALKQATAMLAQNLKQMGGSIQWKSRDDYDVKVTLASGGIFSDDIKRLVKSVVFQ